MAFEFAVKWPLIILFAIHRFLKHIQLSQVKLSGPDKQFKDFVIRNEEDHGYPGFINLIGIESPGLNNSSRFPEGKTMRSRK